MGKNSKRQRMETMHHTVKQPHGKFQIRFLKSPSTKYEKKMYKMSLKSEVKQFIFLAAASGLGALIYHIACGVAK